jgi:hypothetical protein
LPIPPREANVLAVATAIDGTAELRIIRRSDQKFSFEIVAWTNFEDAGGGAHHVWHTFHPELAVITDSFETAVAAALADVRSRMLPVGPLSGVDGKSKP